MIHNLVPSLIIAAAIVAVGLIVRADLHEALNVSADGLLHGIDKLAETKDANGEMAIKKSVSKLVEGIAAGARAGFENGVKPEHAADFSKLRIEQIKVVDGRMENQEKIIGIIHNDSAMKYSDISLSAIVRDKDGHLIDVLKDFTRVEGVIAPGKELGFSIDRDFRRFNDKDDKAGTRAATVDITVVDGKAEKPE
jgi:hypothetical protein